MDTYLEESVLGCMLLKETNWPPEVLALEPEFFSNPKLAQVYDASISVYEKGLPVDEIAVNEQLKEWGEKSQTRWLSDLVYNTPASENLAIWATRLLEQGQQAAMKRKVAEVIKQADESMPAEEMANLLNQTVKSASQGVGKQGLTPVKDLIPKVMHELEERYQDPDGARIAATGIRAVDSMVELSQGDLTIIAGRPSMGKSALAGNVAGYCARNQTKGAVALFSLEMDSISLIRRMISAHSGVGRYQLPKAAHEGSLSETCEHLHKLNLCINDKGGIGVAGIRNDLQKLGIVRLVIVDYLQLAALDPKIERRDLQLGAVTKGLKNIAKEHNCHVIALSQLSRNVEKRKPPIPQLSDLRDSGNIEEDADNVLLLYRGHYYNREIPETQADLFIAKQRNGDTGHIRLHWEAKTQTFGDVK